MELADSLVAAKAREYREREPLYAVEAEQLETLPAAFAAGEYGRRDAVWVVRWYYRRFLGDYPDADRRAAEDHFRDNDFETVRSAIAAAVDAADAAAAVEALTALEAVDVPVASAFCMFLDPDEYVVVGPREWAMLRDADELERPYPDPPSVADYERYLERCRTLADRFDCDLWTLYRALWRLSD
ncbi:hypothetical protein C488_08627 [Natrinema pellirubrum DSM 15624]|uniref:Uncharacterized protein n=1 Tax=Natrinema pellirubrum (strain DSM 15624 / CIP 106293 / JCM 10476 / NCIMB 786 / 157) TaxID=797303 RepID=L0JMD9_NATP1|nr:hypothetical protein [Natrinema pellirubrum]AGB32700.1 hypothetical protein Natpe_2903 [Natrinema pellirubrum DSM 15624]ELY75911.1 hypothetical protein C488_08627 [Natrinema pellirubrum DSM 15624]